MPARIARSSVQIAAPKNARNKNRKRNLDAYSIASHQVNEKRGLKASRFGEFLDDGPKQKRHRAVADDEEEESVEEDIPARVTKRPRAAAGNEDIERGSDSEGNEWTLGGLGSEDDDSDLDSEEAFGDSDEEKFEGFTFRGSSSGKKTSRAKARRRTERNDQDLKLDDEGDGEQDDERDDDDSGDGGIDLATMLDDNDEEMLGSKDNTREDLGEESEDDDGDEDDEEVSEDSEEEDNEEGRDEERVARLRDRLEALDGSTQQSKFTTSQTPALTVDDLLADLDPSMRKQFSAAVKTKKRSEAPKTLAAPLSKRQQDKIDREVATQKAKEQLDRWRDTVIRNRQAEHLSFPLANPKGEGREGTDKFVANDRPRNELEENVRKIMLESGMVSKPGDEDQLTGEEALMKAEELETNKLPVEEVMRRRAELRRARELLFREEIKAKRIAKIKSKSYRRVHRKEKERANQLERDAREAAGLDAYDEDEKERADRLRAEERMNTKHRDSKWAKTLKATNRTAWDEGARDSVIEQARRNEELRRRIAGENVAAGEGSDFSSDGEDYGEEEEEAGDVDDGAVMLRRLDRLKHDGTDGKAKGLQDLKFMRSAEERQRAQNNEDIERLRKELAVQDGDEAESDAEVDDQGLGRAVFGPRGKNAQSAKQKTKRPEMEEGDPSEDEEGNDDQEVDIVLEKPKAATERQQKKIMAASVPLARGTKQTKMLLTKGSDQTGNPWIDGPTQEEEAPNENEWLGSRTKTKREQQRSRALNDAAALDLDLSTAHRPLGKDISTSSAKKQNSQKSSRAQDSRANNTEGWTSVPYQDDNESGEDDSDTNHEVLAKPGQSKQSAYHARAFAGDDVEVAFQAEKDKAIASEDEKEVSNHLPGWGSWTGEGLSKAVRKSNARQRRNPLWKQKLAGVKPSDRQDANLEKVIISERKDAKGGGKKSGKYLASVLPHGFDRKDQYERSLRLPVGPEWVTKETFKNSTKPRVIVKPGRVIEAMEKPMV